MVDDKNNVERVRFVETNLQLIVDSIEKYKKQKIALNHLITNLEKIINDLKTKDEKIANTLYDIWLDPYVINKMYIMRQRPEIEDHEHKRINLALEDILDYVKGLPIYKS